MLNEFIIEALKGRFVDFALPESGNFTEEGVYEPYVLDEPTFKPGKTVDPYPVQATWMGHKRSTERGWGTRNYVIVLGITSDAASYAKALSSAVSSSSLLKEAHETIDGCVAVAHTETGLTHSSLIKAWQWP